MEYSDIYDSRHKRTGRQMVRGEAIRENDYIQASAAVVICDGYILVTRRHPDKKNGGQGNFRAADLPQVRTERQHYIGN